MIDLAHLERLLEEATPAARWREAVWHGEDGGWCAVGPLRDHDDHDDYCRDNDEPDGANDLSARRDAALIAAAVNALPELIAAARERDEWQRAAESQNRQWSQKCEALTEERARREELAAQLLATQQDRYRILSERDALRAQLAEARALLDECGLTITLRSHHTDRELLARIRAWLDALDGKEDA